MSNHSSEIDEEMRKHQRQLIEEMGLLERELDIPLKDGIGATGRFPQGKITRHDEGEIRFAIGSKDGKVIIDFGSQVTWVGMPPEQAIELGEILIKRAKELI